VISSTAVSVLVSSVLTAQAAEKLPPLLALTGFEQRLDATVPLDLQFRDEVGNSIELGECIASKPAILVLIQYRCPMLCNEILNGLVASLRRLKFDAGREFCVVTVSFDAREGPDRAAAARTAYLDRYDRPGAESGWRFLTGEPAAIDQLAEAVGFRYRYDSEQDRFAHPSGLIVVTPQGRVARYFFGVQYDPRDLRLGLVEAADNKIGTAIDQVMLFCYGYDARTGKYTAAVMNMVRAGAVVTVLAVVAFMARGRGRRTRDSVSSDRVPAAGRGN